MISFETVSSLDSRIPRNLLLDADPSVDSVEAYLKRSSVILALLEEEVVGVAVFEILKKTGTLWNISVSEAHRRQRIASELIQAVLVYARTANLSSLEVATGNSSLGQLALYQKCGFRMDSIKKGYFEGYIPPIFENGIQCIDQVVLKYTFDAR